MGLKLLLHCEDWCVIHLLCIRRGKVIGDKIMVSFMGVFFPQILLVYTKCFLDKDVDV